MNGGMSHPARARWPLFLIASPAAVAIWSGWVGLGELCGFGPVRLLPGITDWTLNTAITLPVGVEAYAAYALGAWMSPGPPEKAQKFAKWSALGALAYGMAGQIIYHLLAAAHATAAPWPVVVVVSCMPVAVLGFAAALTHLLRAEPETKDQPREQFLPAEFTDKAGAAEVAYRRSVAGGNPFKPYALATRFEIPRPAATGIVERVDAEALPERGQGGASAVPPRAPALAAHNVPAGEAPHGRTPAPAGAHNGQVRRG